MPLHHAVHVATGFALAAAALLMANEIPDSSVVEPGRPADRGGRFLAHVSTDKPIYRAGEKVFLRGVVLGALDHRPLGRQSNALVTITGPKGEQVANGYAPVEDGVAAFNWEVPDGAAGGPYTAKLGFPFDGFPPAVRKFDVRAYRAPRLKSQIVFLRDGYGPGDTVRASLHVERAEGGRPPART